jgi:tetratricopeptide (TPR) repeat protein
MPRPDALRPATVNLAMAAGLWFATAALPAPTVQRAAETAPNAAVPAGQAGQAGQAGKAGPVCPVPEVMGLLGNGDFAQALMASEECRGHQVYPRLKGQAFHGLYQPDSAIYYLRLALKGGRDDALIADLAESLVWKKEIREAGQLLGGVKDKSGLPYYKAMASLLEAEKKFPKALAMYDKALALEKPPSYGTRFRKAMLLSWMKKLDASIALYSEIINDKGVPRPLRTRCLIRRAEVRAWDHQFDKAVADLEEVVRLESGNAEARLQWGQVLEWQGKFKEAKDQYRNALVIDPGNGAAKEKLEELLWVK